MRSYIFLAASYQSSFNAESMARYWDMKYGDFKISIDLENESENLDALLQKEYFSDYVKRVGDIEELAIYLLMLPYQLISQQTMIFQIAP